MKLKIALALTLAASVLSALTACTGGGTGGGAGTDKFTEGGEHSSAPAAATDAPASAPETDATPESRPENDKWVKLGEGIYDVSSVMPEGLSPSHFLPDKRLAVSQDFEAGTYTVTPLDPFGMTSAADRAVTVEESPTALSYIQGSYLIFRDEALFLPTTSARIYSLETGEKLGELTLPVGSFFGTASDPDMLMVIEDRSNSQHIYEKNFFSGETVELFDWDITDICERPALTAVAEGEGGYAFAGMICPEAGRPSVTCYGLFDKSGEIKELTAREMFECASYRGGLVIYDSEPGFGMPDTATGLYEICDADKMERREFRAEDREEMFASRITVSERGRFLLSGSASSGGCLRVYDALRGILIAKFAPVPDPDGTVRLAVSLAEGERAILVVQQTGSGALMYLYQF